MQFDAIQQKLFWKCLPTFVSLDILDNNWKACEKSYKMNKQAKRVHMLSILPECNQFYQGLSSFIDIWLILIVNLLLWNKKPAVHNSVKVSIPLLYLLSLFFKIKIRNVNVVVKGLVFEQLWHLVLR